MGREHGAVVDDTASLRDKKRVALGLREQQARDLANLVFFGGVGRIRVGDLKVLDVLLFFLFDSWEILRCEMGAILESLERARVVGIPHPGAGALGVSCTPSRALMRHFVLLTPRKAA